MHFVPRSLVCLQVWQSPVNSNGFDNSCLPGSQLQYKVQFVWVNQEDEAEVGLCYSVTSLSHLYFSDVYLYLSLFWDSIPLLVEMQDLMWIVCLQETAISNAWYEVLSVLHLMAMLSLSQANLLLLPRTSADGYQPKVSEGQYLLQVIVNTDSLQYYLPLPFRV